MEDPRADRALLEAMADWCDRYTPLVALDPPDGLLLDISGCAHLFGGEAVLLDDMLARLKAQGFAARGAIAGTLAGAAALARHGRGSDNKPAIVPSGAERAALAALPLEALLLDAETLDGLAQVGLRSLADLAGRPRAPLAARFGLGVIARLDAAFGDAAETLSPRRTPPALVAERRFAEAVVYKDTVLQVLLSLSGTIAETLDSRGEGARLLEAALFRVDGSVSRIRIGAGRPLRDPEFVVRLFCERLKALEGESEDMGFGGFGFDLIRLSVLESGRDDPRQTDMSGGEEADESVGRLIDRLGARLGPDTIRRALPGASHMPESEARSVPATLAREAALVWPDPVFPGVDDPLSRPIRFFSPPEPIETLAEVPEGPPIRFRWRRVSYDVRLAEGPERLAPPWWRGDFTPARDYFRVEDREGRRFWMFREGLYGPPDAAPERPPGPEAAPDGAGPASPLSPRPLPRWYMQGLFP